MLIMLFLSAITRDYLRCNSPHPPNGAQEYPPISLQPAIGERLCGLRWKIYSRDRVWSAIDNPKGRAPAIIVGSMFLTFITPATKYVKLARRRTTPPERFTIKFTLTFTFCRIRLEPMHVDGDT
jgi:hypothetical protein